jgi:histone deacetylase 6
MHTKRVNDMIKQTETMKEDELVELAKKYDSIYFHNQLNKAARWALGSALELVDGIMSDKVQNGFAIIRPPGHHAMHDEPNGYCYFNNAAVAAKIAIEKYNAKRVLIVDWDVHHGQATQRMFYDDPRLVIEHMTNLHIPIVQSIAIVLAVCSVKCLVLFHASL